MWKPPVNFITLHYAYILSCCFVSFIVLSFGNLRVVDALFFGVSSSTGSGLNTVDVKALKAYQQLVTYFIPIFTNIGFINIVVVIVRLRWFEKRFKRLDPRLLSARPDHISYGTLRDETEGRRESVDLEQQPSIYAREVRASSTGELDNVYLEPTRVSGDATAVGKERGLEHTPLHISFAPDPRENQTKSDTALYIPPPLAREQGHPFVEVEARSNQDNDISEDEGFGRAKSTSPFALDSSILPRIGRSLSRATTVEKAVASLFVLGRINSCENSRKLPTFVSEAMLSQLSGHAAIRRNSFFSTMSFDDTQLRGETEYRALRLLLKIVVAYFFGLHLFGALYAAFPMLVMSFLAYAGNTYYPVLLRLTIWSMQRAVPKSAALQEPLQFLLDHPRRCYTLLFPSRQTWILFGNLLFLNLLDVLLIVLLDLKNPAVNDLALGPRILASLFQAACSRHTGAAVFNLAKLNPARSLGGYIPARDDTHEQNTKISSPPSYVLSHLRNQLSFDLWYISLGIFCICIAEADRIMGDADPAIAVFPIFFEVVSAYGNVGLSSATRP
ncbi:hypothetical protein DV736_g5457, partial [Chaetothyriales sp. CBS 134916]